MEEKKMKDTEIIDKRILFALQTLMDHGNGEDAVISFKAGCDDIPDIVITVEDVFSLIHRMEGANSELLGIVDRQKKTILEYNGKDAHQTAEIEALELELSQCNKVIEVLAKENAGLKERGKVVIESLHETIDKQKAEIERLNLAIEGLTSENKVVHKENDELIKQVDELKMAHKDLVESCKNCTAVKDMAKEIFTKLLSDECVIEVAQAELYGNGYRFKAVDIDVIKERAKRYGVEVE